MKTYVRQIIHNATISKVLRYMGQSIKEWTK